MTNDQATEDRVTAAELHEIDAAVEESLGPESRNPLNWVLIIACIYLLLVAVGLIGTGFKTATADSAKELFQGVANPFMGLLIGMLGTALIQSSSTVTSVIVGLVAGGLPVSVAVPMVMGANIGTTITNTIVSLGNIRNRDDFKEAFAAATVHDFFNLTAVAVLLPLELATGYLQKLAALLTGSLVGAGDASIKGLNFIKPITKPVINLIKDLVGGLGLPKTGVGVALALIGVVVIFISILTVGRLLKHVMVGRAKDLLHGAIGRGPLSGIASGTVVTVAVQSSSTTTSLMIPLAGSRVFTVRDIFPFTLGANIGTTITALLAATAVTANPAAALQIALVHLFFNISAVVGLFLIPFYAGIKIVADWPINAAYWLANLAADRRWLALAYMIGVFFVLPGIMVAIFR